MAGRRETFTERARRALNLAEEEARQEDSENIGARHIALGILREREGVAARVLSALGIDLENAADSLRRKTDGAGPQGEWAEKGLSDRAKHAVMLAVTEAESMRHNYIGTEHLLLGILREGESDAAGILNGMGAETGTVRDQVRRMTGYP